MSEHATPPPRNILQRFRGVGRSASATLRRRKKGQSMSREALGRTDSNATRNRGVEAHGIIHQAIKESTNRARRDGRDATYYEKAKAVVLALREAGFDV